MQNELNRLSQKSYRILEKLEGNPLAEAKSSAENMLLLSPNEPAQRLAEMLVAESSEELAAALAQILTHEFYVRTIRALRRKQSAKKQAESLLPNFEHLPVELPIRNRDGKRVLLVDANYWRLWRYYWSLMKQHRERKKNDPQIREAKALLDKLQPYSAKEKKITVRQVLALESLKGPERQS